VQDQRTAKTSSSSKETYTPLLLSNQQEDGTGNDHRRGHQKTS